jgi:drug/metabolite transporter (DMT)-like permease
MRRPSIRTTYILVVILSAFLVALESVAIEGAIHMANLSSFIVSSVPMMVGGLILVGLSTRGTYDFVRVMDRSAWVYLSVLCVFVAGGVLLWFDSVGRIGAGKEALLGGSSSEVLFVVILSAVFLSERLNRWEVVGSILIMIGVLIVLFNRESMSLTLGFGEIEAIFSSLLLGISVVMTTVMLRTYRVTPLSAVELILTGVFLIGIGVALGFITWPGTDGLVVLLILGIFPAMGLLTYNAGLPKIGASLTSVLFATTGIMTVGVQMLVLGLFPGADIRLPENLALAILGGVVAFIGVYLLNSRGTRGSASLSAEEKR